MPGPTFHCPALRWASDHGSAEPSPALLCAAGPDPCPRLPGLLASAEIWLMKTQVGDERRRRGEAGISSLLSLVSVLPLAVAAAHIWARPSPHLGSGSISPLPALCLQTQGGSSFPPQLVSGWSPCVPGALSAVLPPPVPCAEFLAWVLSSCLDPSETRAFLLTYTGHASCSFHRPLQRSPMPLHFPPRHPSLPRALPAQSSLGFRLLERPCLYKASKALEPEPKVAWNEFTSAFLNAAKPRGTGACMKGHCSF